jgi:hydrogenase expression/formation protein HypD
MRYVDEFRDPAKARALVKRIRSQATRPMTFMEFCGGHTHAILRHGIRHLLPETVDMRSGPGCPVCVTAAGELDRAIALANVPDAILTTFGDMIRVPGSTRSLQEAKATGADVRVVYSTLDALQIARENPSRPVIFLGVGFETTAPTVAASILQAEAEGIVNFYVYSVHKLTPPATRAILDAGEVRLSGILGPGHVTTIIGTQAWEFLARDYGLSCAVAGFEPLDILQGIEALVGRAVTDEPAVDNAYSRSVQPRGNQVALELMYRVFEVGPADWRGLGVVPASGLHLRPAYARFDAARAFPVEVPPAQEPKGCRCGEVLRGVALPTDCRLFRRACTPLRPVGPCMVSAEGACAAYYAYGETEQLEESSLC